MTAPRYALGETVRIGKQRGRIISRTREAEPVYEVKLERVPEADIEPLTVDKPQQDNGPPSLRIVAGDRDDDNEGLR